MPIDDVVASLLRTPLFAGLKPLQITEIARQGQRYSFHRGEIIIKAGTPGDGAYLILAGNAACRPDLRTRGEPVAPGSLLGELAMLVEHVYGATIVADGPVQCLKLGRASLHEQMRADPDLARQLALAVAERLKQIAFELQNIDQLLSGCAGLLRGVRALAGPPAMLPRLGQVRRQDTVPGKEKRPTPGEELGARSASCA